MRKSGRGSRPTMKNGSRAITSQKHTLSAAGSCAWVNITRSGPPHIASISPLRSAAAVRAGSGESSSSTSTPSA